jgi:DNA-binding transcriptional LysR family regulator
MTIESNEAIKHSVMSNLGVSILSAHTLTYGGSANLVRLPVRELPIASHWFFVWSKHKRQTVIASAFLDYVEREGRQALQSELRRH